MPRFITVALITIVVLVSCRRAERHDTVSAGYYDSIRTWQKHRDTGLRSVNGWLTLAGLFWLKSGSNTIGCGPDNEFALPPGACPPKLGRLIVDGDKVTFQNFGGPGTRLNGNRVFSNVALNHDEDHPDVIRSGTISFNIIKRGERLAVRARDSDSMQLKHFKGMQYYPTDPRFDFTDARLIPDPKKIPILNIVGQTELEESPGIVEFTYNGNKYHLRPIYEGDTLFFLFKDPTNHTETYQAGRMLNTPLPVNGKVDLDFNRSYTPPCTFSPYATCPLPPKENTLPFPVTAGEKRYVGNALERL